MNKQKEAVLAIIDAQGREPNKLIAILQDVQAKYNYLSEENLTLIAEELGISRQGVHDNLNRTEALLRNMEAKTGCASRDQACRKAASSILEAAMLLRQNEDPVVTTLAQRIVDAAQGLEE